MVNKAYEVEITLKDAYGNVSTRYRELISAEPRAEGAANEVTEHLLRAFGPHRFRTVKDADYRG